MRVDVEKFIQAVISGTLDEQRFVAQLHHAQLYAFCNEVALTVAQWFLDGKLSFAQADAVANEFYALYIGELADLPEPADSIYLAFDRGEYAIGAEDPAEDHTRPMLRQILDEYFKTYK